MTELSNGSIFSHNYLSDFNAEFLTRQKFRYEYMNDNWAKFKKGCVTIDIYEDALTIYVEKGGQKLRTQKEHKGLDLTMREFAIVMLELGIIPEPITGTTTVLNATNFKEACEPFLN